MLPPAGCGFAAGDQLPYHQAVDIQEEDSQRPNRRGASPYSADRKLIDCSIAPAATMKTNAASWYKRISGRNQLVGRIVDVRVSGLVGGSLCRSAGS